MGRKTYFYFLAILTSVGTLSGIQTASKAGAQVLNHRAGGASTLGVAPPVAQNTLVSNPPPRQEKVTFANDTYKIFLVQQGRFQYPRPPQMTFPRSSPTVSCEANISRIAFNGNSSVIRAINQNLAKDMPPLCSPNLSIVEKKIEPPFISPNFINVIVYAESRLHGAGGSCHGGHTARLFDRETGRELQLRDVVSPQSLPEIYQRMAAAALNIRQAQGQRVSTRPDTVRTLAQNLARHKGELGLVIRNHRLEVLFNDYLASCADGNRNLVRLPLSYVTNRKLLNEVSEIPSGRLFAGVTVLGVAQAASRGE
jgi:hypothetical protein